MLAVLTDILYTKDTCADLEFPPSELMEFTL